MTQNKKWQNNVMRKHLSYIIHSKYRKAVKIDGVIKRNVIVFQYTEKGKDILSNPIGYIKKVDTCGRPSAPIYKDEKNILRIDLGANFSNNSDFDSPNEVSSIETKEQAEPTNPKVAIIAQKRDNIQPQNQKLPPEKRKARVVRFPQYAKPMKLSELEPITEAECKILQSKSGRPFTLNAQNEILQDMARRRTNTFQSRKQFLCYFADCLRGEKRDAVATAGLNFRIKARKTSSEMAEIVTQAEREAYLKETEDKAIHCRTDESQYRAKIANSLDLSQAYNFLSNLKTVRRVGEVFEIFMAKEVELTPYSLKMLLQEANAVGGYAGVDKTKNIVL
jgi:hypothetical protein